MRPYRIIQEVQQQQWAMTVPALRAMLALLDGEDIHADDYRFFHALEAEEKQQIQGAALFGSRVPETHYSSIRGNVGFLTVDGPIIPRATLFSDVSGLVSIDRLTAEFKAFEANPRIKTIVQVFDTPGGAVQGVSDYSKLVAASEKDTAAFVWMAASAGYWIASACGLIVSADTGISGSIGTVLSLKDYTEAEAKRGIKSLNIISSQSPNKNLDPTSDEGRAALQMVVNDLADVFIGSVAENMGMTSDDVISKFGGGAMFVARRALEIGMIHRVQGLEEFVQGLSAQNPYGIQLSASDEKNAGIDSTTEEDMTVNSKAVSAEIAPVANTEEIQAAAMQAERERIQGIESLMDTVSASLPEVKAAAQKAVDANKYQAGATRESVAVLVLAAVSQAQVGAVNAFAAPRQKAAAIAETVSGAAPSTDQPTAEESEIAAGDLLIRARDAREAKGGKA